ncbi:MAG: hypothetical protein ACOVRN_03015 [Flavobacterium sp.]
MPGYILTPSLTKSVAEFDTWSNSAGEEVITVQYWRTGEIFVTCDEMPAFEVDPDNGVNLMEYFKEEYFNGKLNYSLDDCYCSQVYSYPDNMRRKRKEWIDDLWEEHNDLEEDGWDIIDTEVWVYCNMTVKESQ